MITLTKKAKKEAVNVDHHRRISIRDQLLIKEVFIVTDGNGFNLVTMAFLFLLQVQEMEQTMPATCRVKFDNPDILHEFHLTILPDEGFWRGGRFVFHIFVNDDYNMAVLWEVFQYSQLKRSGFHTCALLLFQPPKVRCLTRLWHPNITEEGEICLSLLRKNSIDGLGWAPTRKLKDVIWGLNSLFTVCWHSIWQLSLFVSNWFNLHSSGFA